MMWRTGIILAFIVGVGVLAYQIGSRLSDEAIMTIAGVSCGILASIPVSLGLLIALTRERAGYVSGDPEAELAPEPEPLTYEVYRPAPSAPPQPQLPQASQTPQIIVVAPPQNPMPQNMFPYGNYFSPPAPGLPAPAPMQERTFKIVGEEDGD